MRIALGVSIVVAGFGFAPLAASAQATDLTVIHAPQSVEARLAPRHTRMTTDIAPNFKARSDVLTMSSTVDPFSDPGGAMRHRFASSMIDYYPIHGTGFRVSAGVRFFQTSNFLKDAEKSTQGLLYNPRLAGSGAMARTGFARRTPAVTVGYTGTYKAAMFGVEVGSLVGNANANLPHSLEMMSNRARGGMNPIANLVFGLRF